MSTGASPSDPLWDVDMDSDENDEIGEEEDSQILGSCSSFLVMLYISLREIVYQSYPFEA